jgi:hypothetical protein
MFLQLQQHSFFLGKRPNGFTEHFYTEWDDGLGKEKIGLFLVLSIASTQIPGMEVAREAFQLLQDHFLHDLSGDPYDRFENALREINVMVNEKEKDLGVKFVPNVHVVCGVVQKDMLFLSQRGEAQGYLVRKRHLSSITDGLFDEKNKEDLFQNIASGALEVSDSVLLVTGPLVHYLTPGELSKVLSEKNLVEAGHELQNLLGGEIEEQIAVLAFEVLEKTEEVREPVRVAAEALALDEVEESEPEYIEPAPKKDHPFKAASARLRSFASGAQEWGVWGKLSEFKAMERKRLLPLIAGVGIFLVVGVFLLNFTLGKQRVIQNMEEKLATAEDQVAQASTRGSFDKLEASDLLASAEAAAVEILDSGYLGGEAAALLDEIEEQRETLDNVIVVDEELTLLADLTSSLAQNTAIAVAPDADKHVVLSSSQVMDVLIDQVQTPVPLAGEGAGVSATYFADQNNIAILLAKGLLEYTDGNLQVADTADVSWKSGVQVVTYSNKLYILDPVEGQIWRYQRGTSGYTGAQAYVDAATVDLKNTVSMAIDGNVWLLDSEGVITKLLSGALVDFSIKKAPLTSIKGATKLVTDLEETRLFVLDPSQNRVLVYDKSSKSGDLTYSTQYKFEGLKGELVDFYFDKNRNAMILLTESALYEYSFQ